MRILWTPFAQLGSINPSVPYITKLIGQGHEVIALANPALREIQYALPDGITYLDRQHDGARNGRLKASRVRSMDTLLQRIEGEMSDTERAVRQTRPDLVLTHPLLPGVGMQADKSNLPWATYVTYAVSENRKFDPLFHDYWNDGSPTDGRFRHVWQTLRKTVGAPPETRSERLAQFWNMSPYCTVLLAHPLFRYDPRPLPNFVHLAAPVPWDPPGFVALEKILPVKDGRPIVLVTTSTEWQDDIDLVRNTQRACDELGVHLLASVAAEHDLSEIKHPIGFFPHTHLMPHVDAVVGVGGKGSSIKALHFGVPQIVSPRQRDTYRVADLVTRRGLGLQVSSNPSPSEVASALQKIFDKPTMFDDNFRLFERTLERRVVTPTYFGSLLRNTVLDQQPSEREMTIPLAL